MPRAPRWTDEQLIAAVQQSASLGEICRRLGLSAGGGTYASLQRNMRRLGADASHLPKLENGRVRPRRRWTDDDLREAVANRVSLAQVQRRLGYRPSGGMHRYFASQIRCMSIDSSHLRGQGWARGSRQAKGFRARPSEEILVARSTFTSSVNLRRRLIAAGLKQAL